MTFANLELTPEEYNQLIEKGFIRISDPERGEIEVRMFFGEDHLGPKGKRGVIKVIRPGTAAYFRKDGTDNG